MYKNTLIVYFSGTGCTKRVAETFLYEFNKNGQAATLLSLDKQNDEFYQLSADLLQKSDHMLLLFAVHAVDAPEPVYTWLRNIPRCKLPVSIISVSGGGDAWPNTGCHVEIIQALEEIGFQVSYEEMISMPPNVFILKDHSAMHLLKVLPEKAAETTTEILSGKTHRFPKRHKGAIVRWFSRKEKEGSHKFAKLLRITDKCTSCGWCADNCPTNNIHMENGKPVFSNACIFCLRCIYGCPNKAMKTNFFVILKNGFSLKEIEKRMDGIPLEPVEKCMRGIFWAGVRKYMKNR